MVCQCRLGPIIGLTILRSDHTQTSDGAWPSNYQTSDSVEDWDGDGRLSVLKNVVLIFYLFLFPFCGN